MLDDFKKPAKDAHTRQADELDGVFGKLRDDAARQTINENANEQYHHALALHCSGKIDECIVALQAASRAPSLRFAAASLLGRIYRDRGLTAQAIECFERANEAPPTTPEEGQGLLYDLASALETAGELARSLAIFMELHTESGAYRDVVQRIDRLSKTQARG